jgi:hypothetical protein
MSCPYWLINNGTEDLEPGRWSGLSERWNVDLTSRSLGEMLRRDTLVVPDVPTRVASPSW